MRRVLRPHLTHAVDLLRTLGLRRGVGVLVGWLLLRREFVVVAWLIPPRETEPASRADVECRLLDESGLPTFAARCPELGMAEVRRRWAAGMECLVLWHDGAIAAYRWDVPAAADPIYLPYLGRRVRLAPGDVLTYEARTLPTSRRLRLGAELVDAAVARARARGDRRCVGLNAAWNHASLRWAQQLGWERLGTVGWGRAGLGRRYFATGAVSFVDGEIWFPPSPCPVGGRAKSRPLTGFPDQRNVPGVPRGGAVR